MQGRVSCLGASLLGALLMLACGGSKEESTGAAYPVYPQNQPANAGTGQQPVQQQPNAGYGQQPAQQQPAQQQPAQQQPAQQQPAQQPAASVQEVDASMAAPVQPLLQQLAKSQVAPGSKPLGQLIVANFPAPGGKLEKQIQLTGNKCYTVVAAGAPGVSEVNLKFVPVFPLAQAVAVDSTTGAQATLGANPNCWKQIMISAPMTLVVEVPQGQGLVGVQVYEK